MSTHIVLISNQVLQNLIPILMEQPARVVFVITRAMAERGEDRRLGDQLRDTGCEILRFPECPDSDFAAIKAFANQVVEAVLNLPEPDASSVDASAIDANSINANSGSGASEIVLNATGGNKLMSLAFVEALRGIASRILYTDTAHRRIEYLAAGSGQADAEPPAPTPMTDVLDVPRYLRAQRFRFRRACSDDPDWHERVKSRKPVVKFLGTHVGDAHLQQFIGTMNYLANRALEPIPGSRMERLVAPKQSFTKGPPRGIWKSALRELADAALIDWQADSDTFGFSSLEAARFIRGGWLEEYAYHTLKDEGVFDARMSVEGSWDREQTITNEFDVLACHLNQLLVIECKTARFQPGQNDNEIAYKLDSLGDDARGLFGSTWLLCAREPTDILVARARRANIRLIPPTELARLRDLVRAWRG